MAPDHVPRPEAELPEQFLAQAREAVLSGDLAARPQQIIQIARDAGLRAKFLDLVATQVGDPELRRILIEYLEDTAEGFDGHVDTTDAIVEVIDRAALPIASAAVLSGIGLGRDGRTGGNSLRGPRRIDNQRTRQDHIEASRQPEQKRREEIETLCCSAEGFVMDHAFDQNLTLLIIGIIVPLWCAAVVAFAIIKADNSKVLMLSAVTAAFGETLASFGERLRRREGRDHSPLKTGVTDGD